MVYLNYGERSSGGPWMEAKHRYLGLAFVVNGKEHFGWARLSLSKFLFNHTAEIEGYAYETIPGKPTVAGDEGKMTEVVIEPATLGALALGAPALNIERKENDLEHREGKQ